MSFTTTPPLARACSSCPIQNSEFTIHNLPIPLALFRAHYRLKKLFSLWRVKRNSRVVLFCFTDCKDVMILTTHLKHYSLPLLPFLPYFIINLISIRYIKFNIICYYFNIISIILNYIMLIISFVIIFPFLIIIFSLGF